MVPEQKRAVFGLVCAAAALVACLVLIPFLGKGALAGIAVMGLTGLSPLLFGKKEHPDAVEMDERDTVIARRSTLAGGMSTYMVYLLACMVPWGIWRARGLSQISVDYLPSMVFVGVYVFITVKCLATVILYARGVDDAH
jgi:hypothetical protein